jgi:hypothetical protein
VQLRTLSKLLSRWGLALAALSLTNCGGVDSGGTGGSAAIGAITGLGSIIVNGIRFDESAAQISDDDGQVIGRDRLKLGVFTTVEGSRTTTTVSGRVATATRVRLSSDLVGDVQAIDTTTKTIVVLEQTVKITAATVFEDALAQGLDSLSPGMSVEIYARFDGPSGTFAATRVEQRAQPSFRQLRARVDAVDASARTIRVGALVVDTSQLPASDVSNLAAGGRVRLKLQPGATTGSWKAISATPGSRVLVDSEEATVEGRISSFDSVARFAVDGVSIDASTAAFPNGTTGLGLGARVEVEGSSRNGVMSATQVRVEGDEDVTNSVFEIHGPIDAVDAVAKVLQLRSISIDYSGAVNFVGGVAAGLTVGQHIDVTGILQSGGVGIVAQEIKFESN